jgi:hypothetical protein
MLRQDSPDSIAQAQNTSCAGGVALGVLTGLPLKVGEAGTVARKRLSAGLAGDG